MGTVKVPIRRGRRCSYAIISFRFVCVFTPERGPRRARGLSLQRPTENLAFDVTATSRKGVVGSTLGPASSLMAGAIASSSANCGSLVRNGCHIYGPPGFSCPRAPYLDQVLGAKSRQSGVLLGKCGEGIWGRVVAFAGEIRGRKPNRSHPQSFRRLLNSPKIVATSRRTTKTTTQLPSHTDETCDSTGALYSHQLKPFLAPEPTKY